MSSALRISDVHWPKAFKIIPTCFPRADLFERLASSSEQRRALHELEEMTNARERIARREIHLLRQGDYFPEGCSLYLQAAFSQRNRPSRFCDGTYAVCYGALTLTTAIQESIHSRTLFLKNTHEESDTFPMRTYALEIFGHLHDLREERIVRPEIYSLDSYAASSALGAQLWKGGSAGLVYESVRHSGGQCAAVFSPQVIQKYQLGEVLLYRWDGNQIEVFQKTSE